MTKRKYNDSEPFQPFRKRLKEWIDRFDGNYCGRDWSNARRGPSVAAGTVAALTPLDSVCKVHDEDYGQQKDPIAADMRFAFNALRAAMTPVSLAHTGRAVLAGTAVGLQGIARRLNFVEDGRMPRIGAGSARLGIGGSQMVGDEAPHRFPILIMPKYARKGRKRSSRSRRRVYAKRKRSVIRKKYKRNKTRRRYRSRRPVRGSGSGYNRSTFRLEFGSSVNDDQNVTVGQGTSPINVLRVASYAVIRQLWKNHGVQFVNFDELAEGVAGGTGAQMAVLTTYQDGISNPVTNTDYIFVGATKSYEGIAKQWRDFVLDVLNSAQNEVLFQRVELVQTTGEDPVVVQQRYASLDMRRMKLHWSYSSSLRMQNRTASGVNGATIDVNNVNPLEGRVYYQKSGMNYFDPSYKAPTGGVAGYKGWTPFSNVGSWDTKFSAHGGGDAWKEPPTASMAGAIKMKKFAIHPGQIIIDNIGMKGTIFFNNLCNKLYVAFNQQGAATDPDAGLQLPVTFGNCRAYVFEKLVFDRSETAPVTIGYEINQQYHASLSFNKLRSEPVTVVWPDEDE